MESIDIFKSVKEIEFLENLHRQEAYVDILKNTKITKKDDFSELIKEDAIYLNFPSQSSALGNLKDTLSNPEYNAYLLYDAKDTLNAKIVYDTLIAKGYKVHFLELSLDDIDNLDYKSTLNEIYEMDKDVILVFSQLALNKAMKKLKESKFFTDAENLLPRKSSVYAIYSDKFVLDEGYAEFLTKLKIYKIDEFTKLK